MRSVRWHLTDERERAILYTIERLTFILLLTIFPVSFLTTTATTKTDSHCIPRRFQYTIYIIIIIIIYTPWLAYNCGNNIIYIVKRAHTWCARGTCSSVLFHFIRCTYTTAIEKRFRVAVLIFKHITDARRIPMNLSCLLNKRKYPKAIIARWRRFANRRRRAPNTMHNTHTHTHTPPYYILLYMCTGTYLIIIYAGKTRVLHIRWKISEVFMILYVLHAAIGEPINTVSKNVSM